MNNSIVFNLNEYPDINMNEFEEHLLKYFNKYYDRLLYDKYRVYFNFTRDPDKNTIAITADIQDWSYEPDIRMDKMIEELMDKRREFELMEKEVIEACDKYEYLLTDIVLEISGILDSELSDEMTFDWSILKDYIKQGIVKSIDYHKE